MPFDIDPTHLDPARTLGVVAPDSTTGDLNITLVGEGRRKAIAGRMVVLAAKDADGATQYALGTVTQVTTTNRFAANPVLAGTIALRGPIDGISGVADVKTARVHLTSAYTAAPGMNTLHPTGGALPFAPDTGTPVHLADDQVIDQVVTSQPQAASLVYPGTLYRQAEVNLPVTMDDFTGPRGATFTSVFGGSGSGKTYLATQLVAAHMRHTSMGILLFDPQGQFSSTTRVSKELPLDLRALADMQGRDVINLGVSTGLRLPEDRRLLASMAADSGLLKNSVMAVESRREDVEDMIADKLASHPGWSNLTSEELLNLIATHLDRIARAGGIYATLDTPKDDPEGEPLRTRTPGNRAYHAIHSILNPDSYDDGPERRERAIKAIARAMTLFTPTNSKGEKKVPLADLVDDLCAPKKGQAAPLVVLNLAERGGVTASARIQGIILRRLLTDIEAAAHRLYEKDQPANALIVIDEAARFTSTGTDMYGVTDDLVRLFREIRKYAVGLFLILQEPASLHESIWKQLGNGVRIFAPGMVGSDLERMRDLIDRGYLDLYRQLATPAAGAGIYSYLLVGAVSPLSATGAPLLMDAYTAPVLWQSANTGWLPAGYSVKDTWRP